MSEQTTVVEEVVVEETLDETTKAPKGPKEPENKTAAWLLDVVKGFIVGTANVIPGVSGGTLMLVLGIYEKLIGSLSNIVKEFKKSFLTLLPILLGIGIAIISMSRVITDCLTNYPFPTVMLFFGAVLGGLPMLIQRVKGEKVKPAYIAILVVTFALVISLLFLGDGKEADLSHMNVWKFIVVIFMGAIGSATMVIPGVSGSALLMTLGYYHPIYGAIGALTKADSDKVNCLIIAAAFAIGVALGIWAVAKLINMLLTKFEVPSYWGIIGFVVASAVVIIVQNFFMLDGQFAAFTTVLAGTSVLQYVLGVLLAGLGFYGAYKM